VFTRESAALCARRSVVPPSWKRRQRAALSVAFLPIKRKEAFIKPKTLLAETHVGLLYTTQRFDLAFDSDFLNAPFIDW
jgi:hypothetical protein